MCALDHAEHTQTLKFFGAESMLPFGASDFGMCSIVKPDTNT